MNAQKKPKKLGKLTILEKLFVYIVQLLLMYIDVYIINAQKIFKKYE